MGFGIKDLREEFYKYTRTQSDKLIGSKDWNYTQYLREMPSQIYWYNYWEKKAGRDSGIDSGIIVLAGEKGWRTESAVEEFLETYSGGPVSGFAKLKELIDKFHSPTLRSIEGRELLAKIDEASNHPNPAIQEIVKKIESSFGEDELSVRNRIEMKIYMYKALYIQNRSDVTPETLDSDVYRNEHIPDIAVSLTALFNQRAHKCAYKLFKEANDRLTQEEFEAIPFEERPYIEKFEKQSIEETLPVFARDVANMVGSFYVFGVGSSADAHLVLGEADNLSGVFGEDDTHSIIGGASSADGDPDA